jgi:hypothetical protein
MVPVALVIILLPMRWSMLIYPMLGGRWEHIAACFEALLAIAYD